MSDRCAVVGYSFFDPLPVGGVYGLSNTLHDRNNREAIAILRCCAEASVRDGHMFVVERVFTGDDQERLTEPVETQPACTDFVDALFSERGPARGATLDPI